MNNLSLVVIGHGKQQSVFDRHILLWRSLSSPDVTIVSPANDPLVVAGWSAAKEQRLGGACHAGRASVVRLRWILDLLAHQDQSHHLICEYDSFSLSPVIKPQAGLTGIIKAAWEPARFIAPRYPNPPWLLDHESALALLRVSNRFPDVWEEGYADRYFAALAHLAGVPILPYDPPGFTNGTIGPEDMDGMRQIIAAGGRMLHGVKDAAVLAEALRLANR